jgi:hypothetical protein
MKIVRPDFDEYYVKDLNEYNNTIQTLVNEHSEIYFRGVNEARFNLSPSIARNQPKEFTINNEKKLFEAFQRRIAVYKSETYRDFTSTTTHVNLETLAIAQHHGLKTRLLDWSTNPLASLWFACDETNKPTDSYCIVWVLIAPKNRDDYFIKADAPFQFDNFPETKMYVPNIVNPRIKTQSGLFSMHHYDNVGHKYMPLDENKAFFPHKFGCGKINYDTDWDLLKILINRRVYGREILKNLRKFDVHEETIYPSLESVGKRLNFDYEAGFVL